MTEIALTRLFEIQKTLDNRIIEKHGLHDKDLLDEKILSLYAELGELLNEWKGFKFWSENQKPRRSGIRSVWKNGHHEPSTETYDPLLEEYVDCLHFILSIGLELDMSPENVEKKLIKRNTGSITRQFLNIYDTINDIWLDYDRFQYCVLVDLFIELGDMLGFTWNEVKKAYMQKNEINHERQKRGY